MRPPSYFLTRPPVRPDAATEAAFEALYADRIAQGGGGLVRYALPAPIWQFLCWLADTKGLLLHGSGNGGIEHFEPRQSDDIQEFGNRRAVYAASDGIWPIYYAVLDRERHRMSLINSCFRLAEETGGLSEPFYFFSISRDALQRRPWRRGFVYLLPRPGFEPQPPLHTDDGDFHVAQWASLVPVMPLARIAVGPQNFPFLEQIRGHDDAVVWDRAAANPGGFPWLDVKRDMTLRWAEISIDAGPEATDAVGAALSAAGCGGFEVRETAQLPAIVGYLPVDDRLEDRLSSLKDALARLPEYGVTGAGTDLTLRYVEEADWANAWKAFYKPFRVGRRLVVTPPWEHPDLAPDDIPLVIDPGMAFGTGSHPTTQLCLTALEDYVFPHGRIADIGTGSGILAIAAAKLGTDVVAANDNDPLAVKIARENAAVNGVAVKVTEALPTSQYDVVVANILADVIIGMSAELNNFIEPGGILIASGIIDTREDDVRQALEGVGLTHVETRRQTEWVALVFRAGTPRVETRG